MLDKARENLESQSVLVLKIRPQWTNFLKTDRADDAPAADIESEVEGDVELRDDDVEEAKTDAKIQVS